ncbi:phospholipase A1-Ialpha2, chloroplastic-like [Malania oleifera]|uniref:phospholipase A1-Ialpha2, chloroplastic-like n=1 Tax=Malania oleifera TaxID=397392 RepID=UPI0025AE206E|nr:phospholipase A1-Ialpha2, chloroplastic-like [Malania oleifera]
MSLLTFSWDACHGPCLYRQVFPPKKNKLSSAGRSFVVSAISSAPAATTTIAKTTSSLAHAWREVQGSNDWKDLLKPLHSVLRDEIIRYGEFVNACYKGFEIDPSSKRYLNCKHGRKSLLRELGLGNSGYEVTKYIYATPHITTPIINAAFCGHWIGFIAVSSEDDVITRIGRRDILVTFRGTMTTTEWIVNLMSSLTPPRFDPQNPQSDVKVESGFLSLYTSDERNGKFGLGSCREQLLSELTRLINKFKGEELSITVAGHSMGSSLGVLFAYDVAELGLNRNCGLYRKIPITVFAFASPRVGNAGLKERCEELGVKVLRIANVRDPITKMPGVVFNENFRILGGRYEFPWSCSCYAHVGVELAINFFMMQNPAFVHDLEAYISLLRCQDQVQVQEVYDDTVINFLTWARKSFNCAQSFSTSMRVILTNAMVNLVEYQRTKNHIVLPIQPSFAQNKN